MPDPTPEQLAMVRSGTYIQSVSPFVNAELRTMQEVVERRAYNALAGGDLTPQQAFELWVEHKTLHDIERRLNRRVQSAQTVGEEIKESM